MDTPDLGSMRPTTRWLNPNLCANDRLTSSACELSVCKFNLAATAPGAEGLYDMGLAAPSAVAPQALALALGLGAASSGPVDEHTAVAAALHVDAAGAKGPGQAPLLRPQAPLHAVVNPGSGSAAALLPWLREQAFGRAVVWHEAHRPQELPWHASQAAKAAQRDHGLLLAVGGDGTLNAAAQAAWPLQVPMAALAGGTFNYFARAHGLGDDAEQAKARLWAALQRPMLRPVSLGRVNGQVFLVNASLGQYPRLLIEREQAKRLFGRHRVVALASALWSLLKPFPGRRLHLRAVEAQDHAPTVASPASWDTRRVATLFVGNNRLQWQQVGLDQAAQGVGEGRLGVAMLPPLGRAATAAMAARAALGRLGQTPALEVQALCRLQVHAADRHSARPLKVAFDGETRRMTLPLQFEVAPHPLWLLVPQDGQADAVGGA